jgi:hypothetical protein
MSIRDETHDVPDPETVQALVQRLIHEAWARGPDPTFVPKHEENEE